MRRAGSARRFGLPSLATLAAVLLAACAPARPEPDLGAIYRQAAALDTPQRRPVITVPGTLGSRLVDRDSGIVIWGGADRLSADPEDPGEARAIALPMGDGETPFRALRDGVRPDGVLRRARASVLGAPVELDIYGGVIRALIAGGYDFRETREEELTARAQNLDAFEFPYDWRRDIVEAAADLHDFVLRKQAQVEAERRRVFGPETEPVKFDLVAHSMGTLVARWYLMYGDADLPEDGSLPALTWAGAEHVERAFLIAPPNAGSVIAFENLVNGKTFGPLQPTYPPALLGTHVSLYQLMPRLRHRRVRLGDATGAAVDLYSPALWERFGWGLADPDQAGMLATLLPGVADPAERRRIALAWQAQALGRAEQLHRALDRPVLFPNDRIDVFWIIGGAHMTPATASVDPETGAVAITAYEEGDGVVLRASSLLDERQGRDERDELRLETPLAGARSVLLLPEEHVEITRSPVFGDNLLFWLLEGERDADLLGAAAPAGALAGIVEGVLGVPGGAAGALSAARRGLAPGG
jgi:hypothetical protein